MEVYVFRLQNMFFNWIICLLKWSYSILCKMWLYLIKRFMLMCQSYRIVLFWQFILIFFLIKKIIIILIRDELCFESHRYMQILKFNLKLCFFDQMCFLCTNINLYYVYFHDYSLIFILPQVLSYNCYVMFFYVLYP